MIVLPDMKRFLLWVFVALMVLGVPALVVIDRTVPKTPGVDRQHTSPTPTPPPGGPSESDETNTISRLW